MIKRILIIVIVLLLAYVTFVILKNGMTVFGYSVSSIQQIQQTSKSLDDKITQSDELNKVTFQSKNDDLNTALTQLKTEKANYQTALDQSSQDQINKANALQQYQMDFLWTKIGNYATSQHVTLTMDVTTGDASNTKNLNFTVNGSYSGITNFISKIEGDSKLIGFKIEAFNLAPDTTTGALVGTFTVKNLNIDLGSGVLQTSTQQNLPNLPTGTQTNNQIPPTGVQTNNQVPPTNSI